MVNALGIFGDYDKERKKHEYRNIEKDKKVKKRVRMIYNDKIIESKKQFFKIRNLRNLG
jgi:hypothetical protein